MAVTIAELSPDVIARIEASGYDQLIEKHEGGGWNLTCEEDSSIRASVAHPEIFDLPDLLPMEGYQVLLPVPRSAHPFITVRRCIVGNDGAYLTIFLRDTSLHHYYPQHYPDPDDPSLERVAICERVPGSDIHVAILYHECFVDPPVYQRRASAREGA